MKTVEEIVAAPRTRSRPVHAPARKTDRLEKKVGPSWLVRYGLAKGGRHG